MIEICKEKIKFIENNLKYVTDIPTDGLQISKDIEIFVNNINRKLYPEEYKLRETDVVAIFIVYEIVFNCINKKYVMDEMFLQDLLNEIIRNKFNIKIGNVLLEYVYKNREYLTKTENIIKFDKNFIYEILKYQRDQYE